ncbi:MAG: RusA family crossover junction endodeoxyribonuclease [Planctomycetia bacterium]|nr:RusA family crossover junction endodeoxyribonuclease [Planctomycetia bacterium]
MLELTLPFPPSVNHYWRRVGFRTLISREGRIFRDRVCRQLAQERVRPLDGPLAVHIEMYPPDRRRRDCDNLFKALLDALAHGGAYHDDSQIVWLSIERCQAVEQGKTHIWIFEEGVGDERQTHKVRDRLLRTLWSRYDQSRRQSV